MQRQVGERIGILLSACSLLAMTQAKADGFDTVFNAVSESKFIFDARARFESVEQEPLQDESDTWTLRMRAGVETAKAWNTALLIEGEAVTPFSSEFRADNSIVGTTNRPVVADPEAYEVNRLQLTNTSLPNTVLTLGRQRIILDDQRFVGSVGWRQNEQTFDAFRVINKSIPKFTADVSYLNQANRIFGPESPQGRFEGDMFLNNLSYQLAPVKVTGFAYLLDFDSIRSLATNASAPVRGLDPILMSSQTYGLRLVGQNQLSKVKLGYTLSYAQQGDYGSNPRSFALDYYTAELSATYRQFTVGAGQEVLEGNGVSAFQTPLATLHKFQGFADRFLVTPTRGIDDRYATLGYQVKGLGLLDTFGLSATYHTYETELASLDFGDEINLTLMAKWQRLTGMIKYADFKAGDSVAGFPLDGNKLWAQVEYVW